MNVAAAVIVPGSPDEEVIHQCENIGPAERRLRVRIGVFASVATVVLAAVLIAMHAAWPFRLLIALPAMTAAMSFLQAWTHTCVAFVRANIKVMGSRKDRVEVTDEAEKAAFQKKAQRMYLQGALATAVVVGLLLLLP